MLSSGEVLSYPININVEGKKCVVVGGGAVAFRKIISLLEAGAQVKVVAPEFCAQIKKLIQAGRVKAITRKYRKTDVNGAFLVFSATDDREVNRYIARNARKQGILVNTADDPDCCDFTLSAVVRRGELTVAIATGGASPALSRYLREKLEKVVGREYGELASLLGKLREIFKEEGKDLAMLKSIFDSLIDSGILDLLAKKKYKQAQNIVREITGKTLTIPKGE